MSAGVYVDIDYLETASWGEVCESNRGHLCQDWDHAEWWRVQFECNNPRVLVTHVAMKEQQP